MTQNTSAKFLITSIQKQEELLVKMGMGSEDNGVRIAEPVENIDKLIFRFLDTNGDGTGTKAANGNYSSALTKFFYKSPANTISVLYTLIIHIEDNAAFTLAGYGGSVAALTNGIDAYVADANNNDILNLIDDVKIKSTTGWERIAFDSRSSAYSGVGEHKAIIWDFRLCGSPLMLGPAQSLVVALNDDLSHLVSHGFFINGHQHAT
jgi:hypothetical protein